MLTLLPQYWQKGKQVHFECMWERSAWKTVLLDKKQVSKLKACLPGKTSCTMHVF